MSFSGLNKVVNMPSNPHGYLVTLAGNNAGAHTPTGCLAANWVPPWLSENITKIPLSHPCLTMGAALVPLTLRGRLIDPFSCGDPVIRALWPITGPDLAIVGTRGMTSTWVSTAGQGVGCRAGSRQEARTFPWRTSAYAGCHYGPLRPIMTHLVPYYVYTLL